MSEFQQWVDAARNVNEDIKIALKADDQSPGTPGCPQAFGGKDGEGAPAVDFVGKLRQRKNLQENEE